MSTFCLTLHAGYRCRHTGECCRNWTVAAEPHVRDVVETQQIRRRGVSGALFVQAEAPALRGPWQVARDEDGSCVFFDRERGRLCVIHEAAGPGALPSACRHFPRRILRDGRGTFISLSHFCPTAAAMLLAADPLDIVEARPPLRLQEPVEGLDATGALPPLLRPGVLCDLEGYAAWERASLAMFARPDLDCQQALDCVANATNRARRWQPGTGSFGACVDAAFREARPEAGVDPRAQARTMNTLRSLTDSSVHNDIAPVAAFEDRWPDLVAPFDPLDRPMKNFLAAHVFGNWIAYQGRGLQTIVEWLRTCAALVRHYLLRRALARQSVPTPEDLLEAFRMADLLLLHVVDTQAFARQAMVLEGPDPR